MPCWLQVTFLTFLGVVACDGVARGVPLPPTLPVARQALSQLTSSLHREKHFISHVPESMQATGKAAGVRHVKIAGLDNRLLHTTAFTVRNGPSADGPSTALLPTLVFAALAFFWASWFCSRSSLALLSATGQKTTTTAVYNLNEEGHQPQLAKGSLPPPVSVMAASSAVLTTAPPSTISVVLPRSPDFFDWCNSSRIHTGDVMITGPSPHTGRRMMAVKSISRGDRLVSLPRTATLTIIEGSPSPFPHFVSDEAWKALPWEAQLACALLHERQLGEASNLASYIAALPRTFQRAPRLGSSELRALGYAPLERAVQKEREAITAVRDHLQQHGTPFAPHQPGGITDRDLEWALDCVFSRSFGGEVQAPPSIPVPVSVSLLLCGTLVSLIYPALQFAGIATIALGAAGLLFRWVTSAWIWKAAGWRHCSMFPVIDLINHRSSPATPVIYNYFTDRFEVHSEESVSAGAECFISYGPLSNDDLLLRYGFVEANNPYDVYIFDNLLARLPGLSTSLPIQAILHRDGTVDSDADWELCAACGGDRSATDNLLRQAVEAELAHLSTLPPAPSSPNASLVNLFREAKQSVLQDAIKSLAQRQC